MRYLTLLAFIFCLSLSQAALAYDEANAEDPVAQKAAVLALQNLGPSHGALPLQKSIHKISRHIYQIEGINQGLNSSNLMINEQSGNLNATVEDLNKAVEDLGAKVTETEIAVDISSDLLFEFDSYAIKKEAETELTKLALIIQKKGKSVSITGHTDSKGSDDYNQKLSENRAKSVMNWLVKNSNLKPAIFKTNGLGKTKPTTPNTKPDGSDNPDGRAKNRRVEIIIQTKI